ncbi:SpaA isopeptide-forming pilin-related protein [Latilactobacillus sp. 5-91]|uniref:SpaA isopeptide-forming pilin-related protein n=1 Tax=Latilactobacillus sp. 5-91 TaxID=3410924 RepID=UPI003C716DB9
MKQQHYFRKLTVILMVVSLMLSLFDVSALATTTDAKKQSPVESFVIRGIDDNKKAVPNAKINLKSVNGKYDYTLSSDNRGFFRTVVDTLTGHTVRGIMPGKYHISSVAAPTGYQLTQMDEVIEIKTDQDNLYHLYYSDASQGDLTVKAQLQDGTPLADVVLMAVNQKTNESYTAPTSDAAGWTKMTLPAGQYQLKVISHPAGSEVLWLPTVTVNGNQPLTTTVVFGKTKGKLTTTVTDQMTGAPLVGVQLKLHAVKDATYEKNGTTNDQGQVTWTSLPTGDYRVAVTKMLPNYSVVGASDQNVTVTKDETTQVDFTAIAQSKALKITSLSESGVVLPHVRYQITTMANDQQQIVQTDDNGQVTIDKLPAGRYQVRELEVPAGYQLTNISQEITLDQAETAVSFVHQIQRTDATHDVSLNAANAQGKAIAGVQLKLKRVDSKETYEQTVTTDANGQANLTAVPVGDYQVAQEATVAGYQAVTDVQSLTVSNDHQNTVAWQMKRTVADVTFKVRDAETKQPLANAAFTLTTATPDDNGQTVFISQKTNQEGEVTAKQVPTGEMTYQQSATTAGYEPLAAVKTAVVGANGALSTEVTVENQRLKIPEKQQIIVHKTNQQGQGLDNATFVLTDLATGQIQTKKTIAGQLRFTDLKAGRYQIQEKQAPTGYQLDQTPQFVTIKAHERRLYQIRFTDKREVTAPISPLRIRILDDHLQGVAGVLLRLTADQADDQGQTVWELTTDRFGQVILPNASTGHYRVEVLQVPVGYQLAFNQTQLAVSQYGDNQLQLQANRIEMPLQTLTINKTNLSGQPLSGAVFKVESLKTGQVTKIETDQTGRATLGNQKPGRYRVTEVKAPIGYRLATEPRIVALSDKSPRTTNLTVTDKAQMGQLLIKHTTKKGAPIAKAYFEVKDQSGREVGYYQTDSQGQIKLTQLAVGQYTVQEIKAPTGYEINPIVTKVEITDRKTATVAVMADQQAPEVKLGSFVLIDKDQKTQLAIAGATYRLETLAGQVVRPEIVVGATGQVVVSDLTSGKYRLVQLTAAPGYQKQTEDQIIEIKQNTQLEQVTVESHQSQGTVIVNQVDGNTNQALVGAKYELQNQNGKVLIENLKSDEHGQVHIMHLDPDTYRLVQVSATKGYDPLKKPIVFTITNR